MLRIITGGIDCHFGRSTGLRNQINLFDVERAARVRAPLKANDDLGVTDNEESRSSTCDTPLGSIALVHAQSVVCHRGLRREQHQRTTQTGRCAAGACKNA
jgi:hypothetical protein